MLDSATNYFRITLTVFAIMWIGGCGQSNSNSSSFSGKKETLINIGKSAASKDSPLEMLPIVQVDKASDMNIQFCVANNSSKPIGYWKQWMNMSHTWHWELVDRKTGKPIMERPRAESTVPTKDDIQLLAPGEAVLCKINLRDYLFGNIPTGLYEFRVHYSIPENDVLAELGCVPDEFDRTIMLVEVVDRH